MGSILSSGPQPLFLVAAGLSQLVAASFTVHVAAGLTFLYLVSLILAATFTFLSPVSLHFWQQATSLLPQQSLNITGDSFRFGGGKVAFDYLALTVNQELGEVPFDLPAHAATFLGLEPDVERVGLVAVNFYLGKAWESGLVVEVAEVIDFLSGARDLALELVARKV